jgi:hypothetical protein
MSIIQLADASTPSAYKSDEWSKQTGHEIWLVESHIGCVISLSERNGRDDSDFLALVWNDEKGEPETIEYASTRGWSYPCMGTFIDATAEVLTKYVAWQKVQRERAIERQRKRDAATPAKDKRVRIVTATRGKNAVAVGEEGTIFWVGEDRFSTTRYNAHYKALARSYNINDVRDDLRIGVRMDSDGRRVFLRALVAEVIL